MQVRNGDCLSDNSYYRRETMEEDLGTQVRKKEKPYHASTIAGPLMFWIGLVLIAAFAQMVVAPVLKGFGPVQFGNYLTMASNYVLYLPGLIVLPILVAVWVGMNIGNSATEKGYRGVRGLLDGIACALVYGIVIAVVYALMNLKVIGILSGVGLAPFIEYTAIIPMALVIAITPIVTMLLGLRS